jgi:hypothetical protein
VTRLGCSVCETELEGRFDVPPLLRLPAEDLDFVTRFVAASGSLKEMAQQLGQSYPTIRNRLNEIIERLRTAADESAAKRHAILDAIARGELSVDEGAKRLEEVRR